MPARKKDAPPTELPRLERFALSVVPVNGESYCGFLHRLSRRNLFPSFQSILDLIGTYPGVHRLGPATLQRLATASGFGPAVLAKRLGAGAHFGNSEVDRYTWPTATSRICPQCFEEAPIHREIWQHRFVAVCPIHECRIIGSCPDCGLPLGWQRPWLIECRNGHDLRRRQDGGATKSLLAATRHFYERVGLGRPWRKASIHRDVVSLSNEDFAVFVRRLAFLVDKLEAFRVPGNCDPQVGKVVPNYGSDAAYKKAMEIVSNWPTALHELFDPFISPGTAFVREPELLAWIRRRYLGNLSREATEPYRLIKSALIDLATRHGDTFSLRRRTDRDGLVTVDEVHRRTGFTRQVIAKTASKQGWETFVHVVGEQDHVHVKLSDVETWIESSGVVTVGRAGALLGLSAQMTQNLVSMGLLGSETRSTERTDRRSPILLKQSDVQALLSRLRRQRMGGARITRYPAATCRAVPRESGVAGERSFFLLIKNVAEGKLRYWGEPDAPRQWHFDEEDFESLFRRAKILTAEAARIAGIPVKSLQKAAALGMIPSTNNASGRRQFDRSDAAAFARNYCSFTEVRRTTGIGPSKLRARLVEKEVETVKLHLTIVVPRKMLVKHGILPPEAHCPKTSKQR